MSPTPGPDAPLRPPGKCTGCGVNRVAWTRPRVDYCYGCLPGGPFAPPACSRCSSAAYFSQGLCERCHPGSPEYVGSCKDCLAWGVYRRNNWRCWQCRWWASHYPSGDCAYCDRRVPIGEQSACRLCIENARRLQEPGRALDLEDGTRHGLQLYFANMAPRRKPKPPKQSLRAARVLLDQTAAEAEPGWEQPALFEIAPDRDVLRELATVQARDWTWRTDGIVFEHAERYGWSKRQSNQVRRSLKMLQILAPEGATTIRASEVTRLRHYDNAGNIRSTLDVLDAAGLLIDDRIPSIDRFFAGKFAGLPEPMQAHLELWFDIMLSGSRTPPRRKPREESTVRIQTRGIAPIVTAWAEAGHQSFAEITPELVLASLPADPTKRHAAMLGFRSLFTILNGRKLIFADPTRNLHPSRLDGTIPMPLEPAAIRAALNHPDPAIALGVALVAFHALTNLQVRNLQLTDVVDGRLTMPDRRVIPLAEPVRTRLTAWLDYRATKWPHTLNQHLFVTRQTAPRLNPPGHQFPWKKAGMSPKALREDRILHEIHAAQGDARRLCDLFGLSVEASVRYARALGASGLDGGLSGR